MTSPFVFCGSSRRAVAPLLTALAIAVRCAAEEPTLGVPLSVDPVKPSTTGNSIQEAHVPPALIFFPPVAPPLGMPVVRATASSLGDPIPPPELSIDVNETFYAPLSTLLVKNELSGNLRQRLAAYRAARDSLQHELQAELARVRPADADTRQRALAALARQQAPRLAALEKTAEELRQDMVDGFYGWFGQREWQLGGPGLRGDTPEEVAAVMQAYVFFKKGLLPAQRGLLREISLELASAREDSAATGAAEPYFLFSPETARVRLPAGLPAPLAARVAEYQTKKSALKKELYDAVYEQEQASFLRGNILKSVAADQAGRLAELERLAEEIRRDIAALPGAARPGERPPLPPVLTERVTALVHKRTSLETDAQTKIEEIYRQKQTPEAPVVLSYVFGPTGLNFEVKPRQAAGQAPSKTTQRNIERKIEELRLALAAIAADYGRAFAEIANEMIAMREAIADTLTAPNAPTPEAALSAALRYVALKDTAEAYRDYRTAVFEPGLSPEQRRLLFGRAIEELHLPLPSGELQPTNRRP